MKKILVTGANGFVGKNAVVALRHSDEYEVITIDKENSEKELKESVLRADFIDQRKIKNFTKAMDN